MRHATLLAVVLLSACVGEMLGGGSGGGSSSGGGSGQAGGGSGGGSGGGVATGDLPCAVATVLTTCQQCHGATLANGAPMHMLTRADLLAPSVINPDQKVGERCVLRMQAPTGPMPPAPNARIDAALISSFNDWVTRGMPAEGCGGTGGGAGGGDAMDGGGVPFDADPPAVYVSKVKTVLVGLPPTDAEIAAVTSDPSQLATLVDEWQHLPQYQAKMLRFFELAFQQTQITSQDFTDLTSNGQMVVSNKSLLQNAQESFARTAQAQNAANVPFNKLMSTQQYMMTTALQVFYAVLDTFQVDNAGTVHDAFKTANAGKNIVVSASSGPIPIEQSIDPASPNYLHFFDPSVVANCGMDPFTTPARANVLFEILMGGRLNANQYGCGTFTAQLLPGDFSDWHLVTVRKPHTGEKPTAFYDLPALRAPTQNTLVLNRPFVGFFTTPAFFANWHTNDSNESRVTFNQTVIVATGTQVDGTDTTTPTSTPGLDAAHANQAACNYCHQTLDPSRSIFSATYSWNYGTQLDATWSSQKGRFAYRGVEAPVTSIYDLGSILSTHPLLAGAWVQKLCYWVNSQACEESDPEYQRLVTLFQSSSYAWDPLVKAVVTSPLTTHASATLTASQDGATVAVARRDHLCALWNARLGFTDVCGFDVTRPPTLNGVARQVVPGLPSDGYSRGGTVPVLPNDPSLFYRAGLENLCAGLAALVIDNASPPAGARTWSSSQPTAAIADFVNVLAGLPPSDPRAAGLQQLLTDHYNTAKATSGITAKAALQSTFMAACMAPSASAIGL